MLIRLENFKKVLLKLTHNSKLLILSSDRNRSKILNRLTECFKIPVNRLTVVKCLSGFKQSESESFKHISPSNDKLIFSKWKTE